MEPASDSNLFVPRKGARRASQLYLFSLPMEGERIEESRETIPQVWKGVSEREWNDWRWQLRHRITTLEQLKEVIDLTPEETEGIKHSKGRLA